MLAVTCSELRVQSAHGYRSVCKCSAHLPGEELLLWKMELLGRGRQVLLALLAQSLRCTWYLLNYSDRR